MTNEELIEAISKVITPNNMTNSPLLRTQAIEALVIAEKEIKERLITGIDLSKKHLEKSLKMIDPSIVEASKDYVDGVFDSMNKISENISDIDIVGSVKASDDHKTN